MPILWTGPLLVKNAERRRWYTAPEMAAKRTQLDAKLLRSLPAATAVAVRLAIEIAQRRGSDLYLVGGGVRDLLLGAPVADVDLVTEGDALALAGAIGRKLRARVVRHPRFGTAAVQGDGFHLDLARSRTEQYERPGALPLVRPGRLADDLARRDFTINAMALRLSRPAGKLIDPFAGRADLSRERLRVLHDASFQDDPTRLLRALRYAGRLGFRIERHTASLLTRDLSYLAAVTGTRLRHELERIAAEERVGRIVRAALRLGVLRAVHPALRPRDRALRAIARLPAIEASRRDDVLFCLLLSSASLRESEAAIERLALTGAQAAAVRAYAVLRKAERRLARPSLRASGASRMLDGQPAGAIEAFALSATQPLAARRARRYLEDWRFVRPRLNGHDLEALGVARGPQIGELLALLHEARLDGRTRSREDEVAFIETKRHKRAARARRE